MSDAQTYSPRISLMKYLKGDKQYIPENAVNYTFEGKVLNTAKRKALEKEKKKKGRIGNLLKSLPQRKS